MDRTLSALPDCFGSSQRQERASPSLIPLSQGVGYLLPRRHAAELLRASYWRTGWDALPGNLGLDSPAHPLHHLARSGQERPRALPAILPRPSPPGYLERRQAALLDNGRWPRRAGSAATRSLGRACSRAERRSASSACASSGAVTAAAASLSCPAGSTIVSSEVTSSMVPPLRCAFRVSRGWRLGEGGDGREKRV